MASVHSRKRGRHISCPSAARETKETIFFFFLKIYLLIYVSTLQLSSDTPEDCILTDGCEPPCGCWELNSRPLEEQSVLLTAEPISPAPYLTLLNLNGWIKNFKYM